MTDQWLKRIYHLLFVIGGFYFLSQDEFFSAVLIIVFHLVTGIEDKNDK